MANLSTFIPYEVVGVSNVCKRIVDTVTGDETKDMEDILARRHSCKSPDGRSTPN